MSDAENISQVMIPFCQDDTKRSKYLGFRVAGFSVREAMGLAKCSMRSVKRWRELDLEFNELDTVGLVEARKQLSSEYINIEFTRNYHMVLQKDFDILIKAITGVALSDKEHQYLLKLRGHYTPQQLMLIKQLVGEVESAEPFDFTKLTFTLREERRELIVKAETDGVSTLPQADGHSTH